MLSFTFSRRKQDMDVFQEEINSPASVAVARINERMSTQHRIRARTSAYRFSSFREVRTSSLPIDSPYMW